MKEGSTATGKDGKKKNSGEHIKERISCVTVDSDPLKYGPIGPSADPWH